MSLHLAEADRIEHIVCGVIDRQKPCHLVTLNALMYDSARSDSELSRAISAADAVVADSAGLCWAIRLLTGKKTARCAGIDLIYRICDYAASHDIRIFLYGARPGIAEEAGNALKKRFPRLCIAGTEHGYRRVDNDDVVIRSIRASGASILFAALSSPYQEKWLAAHRNEFGACLLMGVGGSFDVISGRLHRAPRWMQKSGFEWLYRLVQQPERWQRMARLPLFVLYILRLKACQILSGLKPSGTPDGQ